MFSLKKVSVSLVLAATAAACALPTQAAEWKGWNIHKAGYPNTVAMDDFARLLNEKTDGRISLKMYHAGTLGSQPDAIEQVRLGGLEVGNFSLGPIGPIAKEANVVSLPFVFSSVEQAFRAMDGEVGKMISDGLEKKGIVALAYHDAGARSFYNTQKPITQPSDVKGMKIRVMNNDLYSGMISALGGNPSPMAFSEVYQALKTNVVDGAENNYPSYESTGHYEVAGYYSVSQHLIIPECVCMNAKVFNSLSEADQKAVREAAVESAMLQRKLWAERKEASRAKAVAAGVKINEISDKGAFQSAMQSVHEKYLGDNPDLKPLVQMIKDTK
ncbi:TRAP transporter substrate-binding protein [Aestuariirhabdus sp. Z084]|uniref:TRAP transporter substrate-binding protein n=1 Tax=Aestuariirhabdus haliotis TaxID=2918751 RepID=UPI00201B3F07|nr:TRAP transporter substrate-binding protein [Aestuariirhabdus haliotis]MCL6415104.1 TRAP transporter substrate-binding protein [Aestuariirhabdus haliotis]MCL6419036.1 TRAP transporter substrate-binding protein [Aestuariirhabdus haliotis]